MRKNRHIFTRSKRTYRNIYIYLLMYKFSCRKEKASTLPMAKYWLKFILSCWWGVCTKCAVFISTPKKDRSSEWS